jgi:hypothetical protein
MFCPLTHSLEITQSIGLVEGVPNLVSELNGGVYLTQRTSTGALQLYMVVGKRAGVEVTFCRDANLDVASGHHLLLSCAADARLVLWEK